MDSVVSKHIKTMCMSLTGSYNIRGSTLLILLLLFSQHNRHVTKEPITSLLKIDICIPNTMEGVGLARMIAHLINLIEYFVYKLAIVTSQFPEPGESCY
jgi:hypothetical protein